MKRVAILRPRRGNVIIYTVVMLAVMFGFCSFAVDFGKVQVAKTELRRAADSAARAAAYYLSIGSSTSTIQSAAAYYASLNKADGSPVVLTTSTDVLIGYWNASSHTFTNGGTPNNAVEVYCRRTAATGNAVPLTWAAVLGKSSCNVTASSIAAIITTSDTNFVNATSNPWLAGQSAGTQGSEPDPGYVNSDHEWKYDIAGTYGGTNYSKLYSTDYAHNEPYASPYQVNITLVPGATITVTNVSGTASNDGGTPPSYTADGMSGGSQSIYSDDAATDSSAPGYTGSSNGGVAGSEFGIANINTPIDSLNGVFLDANNPNADSSVATPPGLDFSDSTEQNYSSLSPLVRQPFYIGNGQTSSTAQQSITVPANATRLFLGTMDGHEWSNNSGGFNVTITQSYIEVVQ